MSSVAQYQFAAEFVTFLACAAGLAVVVLRSELITKSWWAQTLLTAGFLVLGTAAFLHGALVGVSDSLVFTLRGAGIVALAAGTMEWRGPPGARRLLWLGLGLAAASLAVASTDSDELANLSLGLGAVGIGASVLATSRRSIAARVAASAALVLLLVVLVLSLALSTVISSTVRDEALRRLSERGTVESALIENRAGDAIRGARLTAVSLQTAPTAADELLKLYSKPQHSGLIDSALASLSDQFLEGLPLAYLSFDRTVLASYKLDQREVTLLAGSAAVGEAIRRQIEVGTSAVIGNRALAIGISPVAYRPNNADGAAAARARGRVLRPRRRVPQPAVARQHRSVTDARQPHPHAGPLRPRARESGGRRFGAPRPRGRAAGHDHQRRALHRRAAGDGRRRHAGNGVGRRDADHRRRQDAPRPVPHAVLHRAGRNACFRCCSPRWWAIASARACGSSPPRPRPSSGASWASGPRW